MILLIKYLTGEVITTKSDYIAFPANTEGIMGSGLALDIKNKYPNVWVEYKRKCKDIGTGLFGTYIPINVVDSNLIILACFTQTSASHNSKTTNLNELKKIFKQLEKTTKEKKTITIPYRYGCGVNNASWNEVHKILYDIFDKSDVILQIVRKWEWTDEEKVVD